MAPTVYIETSVVSYLVARSSRDVVVMGHQAITVEWWEQSLPKLRPFVSQYVLAEAGRGDPEMAQRRLKALASFPILPTVDAAERLAEVYLRKGLVPPSEALDALHLALASAHGITYMVTWNCRHLAAASVRRRIPLINAEAGFPVPTICTPEELMDF